LLTITYTMQVWYPGDRCFPGPLMLLPKALPSAAQTEAREDDAWCVASGACGWCCSCSCQCTWWWC